MFVNMRKFQIIPPHLESSMAFAFSTLVNAISATLQPQEKILCFHCNDKMRKKNALMASFNGASHPVCCHGCLAVLNTIVSNGLTEQYLQAKANEAGVAL
ncbi:heavy metal translocating P-type ATPase metal-binding domain-containing protein [Undibacterium sp.]|uniref:heavy metal translocating P-type ATPase metal-binding domain-containing protein n=1 Tax=Undibacterium sp. TaxID=1914977 RepID=UPI0025FE8F37|nr:heavy metal translocating P-type ATPase metal-binding domain-containing protein [Undibacterium sp.]